MPVAFHLQDCTQRHPALPEMADEAIAKARAIALKLSGTISHFSITFYIQLLRLLLLIFSLLVCHLLQVEYHWAATWASEKIGGRKMEVEA